jgi:hypothetical protein
MSRRPGAGWLGGGGLVHAAGFQVVNGRHDRGEGPAGFGYRPALLVPGLGRGRDRREALVDLSSAAAPPDRLGRPVGDEQQ